MSCRKSYQNFLFRQTKKELSKMITFSPPSPPKYTIIPCERNSIRGNQYIKCNFIPKIFEEVEDDLNLTDSSTPKGQEERGYTFNPFPWISVECFQIRKTDSKVKIVTLYIQNISVSREHKNTIIYSHGNSSDLGSLYSSYIDLASQLKCDIIAYDYTGYGHSEGIPNEKDIYSDIEHVMDYALAYKQLPLEKIILFGSSIGSVPSISIASSARFCSIKGCILVSPISSGSDLIKYSDKPVEGDADVLNNLRLAKEIMCPVFVIHGKVDKTIPIQQSYDLMKEMKNGSSWYPNKGSHSNITTLYRSKYYQKLKDFFKYINDCYSKIIRKNFDTPDQSEIDSTTIHFSC